MYWDPKIITDIIDQGIMYYYYDTQLPYFLHTIYRKTQKNMTANTQIYCFLQSIIFFGCSSPSQKSLEMNFTCKI